MPHQLASSPGLSISDFVQHIKANANVGDLFFSDEDSQDLIIRNKLRQALLVLERNHYFRYMKETETLSPPSTQFEFWTQYHWKKIDGIDLFVRSTGQYVHTLANRTIEAIPKPWLDATNTVDYPTYFVLDGMMGRPNAVDADEARAGNISAVTPVIEGYWAPDLYRQRLLIYPLPSATDLDLVIRGYTMTVASTLAANDNAHHWLLDFAEDVVEAKVMLDLAGPFMTPEMKRDYSDQFTIGLQTLLDTDEDPISEDDQYSMEYHGEVVAFEDDDASYPLGFRGILP